MIAHFRLSTLYATAFFAVLLAATYGLIYLSLYDTQDVLAPGDLPPSPEQALPEAPSPTQDLALETFLPQQTLALSPTQALATNLARPLAASNPIPPQFDPTWLSEPDRSAAATCLATAIYYEAATEPVAGQQAVAQVILNRLRNPHYPKTVCDVVYEGARRRSGCQFTFACDGSLARRPNPARMAGARAVAEAALRGSVSFPAGQATHYHTVWIVPRWANELSKVAIIGQHIFYRPPRPYGGYPQPPATAPAAFVSTPATPGPLTATVTNANETERQGSAAEAIAIPAAVAIPQLQPDPMPTANASPDKKKAVYFPEVRRRPSNLAIPSNR